MLYPAIAEITEDTSPGIYRIEHEAYHASPGVSSSQLKSILKKSPAHAQVKIETTPAMEFGTAFHTALLEPELFDEQYTVRPEGVDFRTADGKQWRADNEHKTILKNEDYDRIQAMLESVYKSKYWDRIKGYDRELACVSRHKETGMLVKCKPDMLGDLIVDIKTTKDASPEGFKKSLYSYFNYALSAAFYQDIVADITGKVKPFLFCAVESAPPHAVAWYEMPIPAYEEGARQYQRALLAWAKCEASDEWPGYPDEIKILEPPPWFFEG